MAQNETCDMWMLTPIQPDNGVFSVVGILKSPACCPNMSPELEKNLWNVTASLSSMRQEVFSSSGTIDGKFEYIAAVGTLRKFVANNRSKLGYGKLKSSSTDFEYCMALLSLAGSYSVHAEQHLLSKDLVKAAVCFDACSRVIDEACKAFSVPEECKKRALLLDDVEEIRAFSNWQLLVGGEADLMLRSTVMQCQSQMCTVEALLSYEKQDDVDMELLLGIMVWIYTALNKACKEHENSTKPTLRLVLNYCKLQKYSWRCKMNMKAARFRFDSGKKTADEQKISESLLRCRLAEKYYKKAKKFSHHGKLNEKQYDRLCAEYEQFATFPESVKDYAAEVASVSEAKSAQDPQPQKMDTVRGEDQLKHLLDPPEKGSLAATMNGLLKSAMGLCGLDQENEANLQELATESTRMLLDRLFESTTCPKLVSRFLVDRHFEAMRAYASLVERVRWIKFFSAGEAKKYSEPDVARKELQELSRAMGDASSYFKTTINKLS